MDGRRFDELTRALSHETSRRRLLGRVTVGMSAAMVARIAGPRPAGAEGDKVAICHRTNSETNPWEYITVSVNAEDRHQSHHGDVIGVDILNDPNHCGECGNACASGACQDGRCVAACTPSRCGADRACGAANDPEVCRYYQKTDGTCLCTGFASSDGSPRGCVDDDECVALYGPGTSCVDAFFYNSLCNPTACYLPCEGDPSTGYCCSASPPQGGGCGSDAECAAEFGAGYVCRVSWGGNCYTRSTVCHLPCPNA